MKGTVRATKADVALIETGPGEFAVVQVLGGGLDLGDEVEGELDVRGDATLALPAGGRLDVYVHDVGCAKAVAAERARRLTR